MIYHALNNRFGGSGVFSFSKRHPFSTCGHAFSMKWALVFLSVSEFWIKMNPYFPRRWLRLLHVLVLNLPISLLVLISQRAMSGQVNLYYFLLIMYVAWPIAEQSIKFELIIGAKSFNRRSLHHIGDGFNPYEQAISIIGKTLAAFDEDNLIPCFGFGDGMYW